MNTTLLRTCFVIGLAYTSSVACVSRECTAEEQREVGASGGDSCETFTAPEPHESAEESITLDYVAGSDLQVSGDFRNLEIEAGGNAGEVVVRYKARVDLAEGREDDVVEATLAELDVGATGGSTINVTADRSGDSNVAALFEIVLPPEFDGDLTIEQADAGNEGGEVELSFIGTAANLRIDLNSGNTDFVLGDASHVETAEISVNGLSELAIGDFLSPDFAGAALSSDSGDIKAGFPVVPSGVDVQVLSESGNLEVGLPGEGDYTMQATSENFTFSANIPSACDERTSASGGSLTCGAGADSLTFTLTTDGAIDIDRFVVP